jgi:hypothetical protein
VNAEQCGYQPPIRQRCSRFLCEEQPLRFNMTLSANTNADSSSSEDRSQFSPRQPLLVLPDSELDIQWYGGRHDGYVRLQHRRLPPHPLQVTRSRQKFTGSPLSLHNVDQLRQELEKPPTVMYADRNSGRFPWRVPSIAALPPSARYVIELFRLDANLQPFRDVPDDAILMHVHGPLSTRLEWMVAEDLDADLTVELVSDDGPASLQPLLVTLQGPHRVGTVHTMDQTLEGLFLADAARVHPLGAIESLVVTNSEGVAAFGFRDAAAKLDGHTDKQQESSLPDPSQRRGGAQQRQTQAPPPLQEDGYVIDTLRLSCDACGLQPGAGWCVSRGLCLPAELYTDPGATAGAQASAIIECTPDPHGYLSFATGGCPTPLAYCEADPALVAQSRLAAGASDLRPVCSLLAALCLLLLMV